MKSSDWHVIFKEKFIYFTSIKHTVNFLFVKKCIFNFFSVPDKKSIYAELRYITKQNCKIRYNYIPLQKFFHF